MATSLSLLLPLLVSTTAASPVGMQRHSLRKRAPSSHSIGVGFAIAISILIFASLIFYLGVMRGRTGSWFCWRNPVPSFRSSSPSDKLHVVDPGILKSRISSPIHMQSSALPELSPVVAQPRSAELSPLEAKPKLLELSANEKLVFEMGQVSPRRPPSVASTSRRSLYSSRKSSIATAYRKSVASVGTTGKSVYSTRERPPQANSWFDRKSWFCRGAMEVENEEKKTKGEGAVESLSRDTLAAPPAAIVTGKRESTMDWSGMEWLAKMYTGRKSRHLSGMKSFYISGDEKS